MAKLGKLPFLSGIAESYTEAFLDNSDGLSDGRRSLIMFTYLAGILSSLTVGAYFTGMMLSIGADEMYVSYISIASALCGFLQFLSPLYLERMERRKPFLIVMKSAYLFLDIIVLSLVVLIPMNSTLRLVLFMLVIIMRNTANALSSSGITIWQMQSVPPEKQNSYFTFSNIGTTIIGAVSAYLASSLMDTCESSEITVAGVSPTVTGILILRLIALVIAVPEMIFFARIKEYPYAKPEKKKGGLKLLLLPLTDRKFVMTVSIPLIYNFSVCIIGEFFNVYLISIVHMTYSSMSIVNVISMPMALIFTPVWSALVRKFGWVKMVPLSLVGFSFAYFFNALITETSQYLYYAVIIIYYIFNPCIAVVFSYLQYINMPETNRTAYISFVSLDGTDYISRQFLRKPFHVFHAGKDSASLRSDDDKLPVPEFSAVFNLYHSCGVYTHSRSAPLGKRKEMKYT